MVTGWLPVTMRVKRVTSLLPVVVAVAAHIMLDVKAMAAMALRARLAFCGSSTRGACCWGAVRGAVLLLHSCNLLYGLRGGLWAASVLFCGLGRAWSLEECILFEVPVGGREASILCWRRLL